MEPGSCFLGNYKVKMDVKYWVQIPLLSSSAPGLETKTASLFQSDLDPLDISEMFYS